jgi:type IV pilus assembly protein PilC
VGRQGPQRQDRARRTARGGENQVQASCAARACSHQDQEAQDALGKKIKPKDIALFTRQLATMMKAGVPLLQAFDIVGRGNTNPSVTKLLNDIRADVETGTSLSGPSASTRCTSTPVLQPGRGRRGRRYPGIAAGPPGHLHGKDRGHQVQDQVGADVPDLGDRGGLRGGRVIMIFVIPAFKEVFTSFGADLPAPTLLVIAISEFFVQYWWLIFGVMGGGVYFFMQAWKRNEKCRCSWTACCCACPIFGELIDKSCIARWTRTLSTMFAAGVPLVEALDSVGGASATRSTPWPPTRSSRKSPPAPA